MFKSLVYRFERARTGVSHLYSHAFDENPLAVITAIDQKKAKITKK